MERGIDFNSGAGNLHPLYFPNILKSIFHGLGVRDLKNCRLVCSTWGSEATKRVGQSTVIKLQTRRKVTKYVQDIIPFRVDSNVQSIANANNIHLCASTLIYWYERPRKTKVPNLTTDFIANYGDTVKILDLNFQRTPEVKLKQILQSQNLKNLKKFIVEVEEKEECFLNFSARQFPQDTEIEVQRFIPLDFHSSNQLLEDEDLEECKKILQAQLLHIRNLKNLNMIKYDRVL